MKKLIYYIIIILFLLSGIIISSYLNAFLNNNTQQEINNIIETNNILLENNLNNKDAYFSQFLFESNNIVCLYGHPQSKKMGILGRYSKEKALDILTNYANEYDKYNGDKGVIPAFYIIYGTCQPAGEIRLIPLKILEPYIEFALSNNILIFLDHQIGKYSIEYSINKLLPFLKYPNVHLALDPEWRTLKPMKEIGSVTADEINLAQKIMQQYIISNNIQGKRLLVVHQFHYKMIRNRLEVRTDYDPVILVHTMDGFGSPNLKIDVYKYNSRATNMPWKGFKLFLESGYPFAGYDSPLMNPEKVLSLNPQPILIIYQ